MTKGEFIVRTREAEIGHGHRLRVSTVQQPRGGSVVVIQKLTEPQRGVPLLDGDGGRRVVVDEMDVPTLRKMLEGAEEEL